MFIALAKILEHEGSMLIASAKIPEREGSISSSRFYG